MKAYRMLLGSGVALAHELDLFNESGGHDDTPSTRTVNQEAPLRVSQRCDRLKRLMFIYINQLASRIGCTVSKLPFHSMMNSAITGPATSREPQWHDLTTCWVDLTRLVRSFSEISFPSQIATDITLRNGRYIGILEHFQHLLRQWWNRYLSIAGKAQSASYFYRLTAYVCLYTGSNVKHDLLLIEYQYVRVYINSLTLQAIAARMTVGTYSSLRGQYEIDAQDNASVREIIDGCTSILQTVLKLDETGHLKYIPNRISVRIASASMYLLKVSPESYRTPKLAVPSRSRSSMLIIFPFLLHKQALAVGVQRREFNSSLQLLDHSIRSLRAGAVDDMHLTAHYASLLENHIQALQGRFVCISNPMTNDISRAPSNFGGTSSQSLPALGGQSTLVDEGATNENESWLVLPFDPSMTDAFQQGITQNIFGFNMEDSIGSFWDLLP